MEDIFEQLHQEFIESEEYIQYLTELNLYQYKDEKEL